MLTIKLLDLAKKRLDKALAQVQSQSPDVTFTVVYLPYQLFNDAPGQWSTLQSPVCAD